MPRRGGGCTRFSEFSHLLGIGSLVRSTALVRAAAVVATTVLTGALLSQPAFADDTPLPVVGPDTVTLYPGQSTMLNLLDNDSSPTGDDLALCRFPGLDLFSMDLPDVLVMEMEQYGGEPGEVLVQPNVGAQGTHEVDYYVCDHTHLVPATLTVIIRDVATVEVTKLPHKAGRLHVTNPNDKPIRFWYGDPRANRPDGRIKVAAGDTVTVRVQRHRIQWIALIGPMGKAESMTGPGIAGYGIVRDIKLNGKPLPAPHGPRFDDEAPDGSILGRWR